MKTIIAGSRTVPSYSYVEMAMQRVSWEVSEVVSGLAKGADKFGMRWALEHKIPVAKFPADWDKHGKPAGFIRNREMAKYADKLIVIWDGESRGTKNMIKEAKAVGMEVVVCLFDELEKALEEEKAHQEHREVEMLEGELGSTTEPPEGLLCVEWKGVKIFYFEANGDNHATINFAVAAIKEIDRLEARLQNLEEEVGSLKTKVRRPPQWDG